MLKYQPELDLLLFETAKDHNGKPMNPGLLSSEWQALDEFFPLPLDAQERVLQAAINDPHTSGPLIRAMRRILRIRRGFES